MARSSVGFNNGVCYANNVDFSGNLPVSSTITTDGQLLIGSTALNAGGTNINVGKITCPDGSISIGFSTPNITLSAVPSTDLHAARFIVSHGGSSNGANYSTIATAYAAAVAAGGNQTVFVQPGTYTENITLSPGINITAFGSDSSLNGTGAVIISGNLTMSSAGSVTISGIQLQTNSAAFLTVSGSVASIVNLNNCYLNCSNATGISYSSSSASSQINLQTCSGNIGTTGIALYSMSSTGTIRINNTFINNTGSSTTASSNSAGQVNINNSEFATAFSTSSSGGIAIQNSDCDSSAVNTTTITTAGTGTVNLINSYIAAGTASSVSVGAGTTVAAFNSTFNSSNTNNITGAGTFSHSGCSLIGGSFGNNVTTQLGGVLPGNFGIAPSAGYIGEQIRSTVASGAAISPGNGTPANITSIILTAGVWDVSAVGSLTNATCSQIDVSISTTSATLGTAGDNSIEMVGFSSSSWSATIPSYRLTLTTTTTVFLVGQIVFGAGTGKMYGRISATRVG